MQFETDLNLVRRETSPRMQFASR